jgi:hypothetical protein
VENKSLLVRAQASLRIAKESLILYEINRPSPTDRGMVGKQLMREYDG